MTTSDERKLPVEIWEVDKLYPHPKNAKKHPPEQLEKLAKSIGKFKLANPPHIEADGCIIAGTGRWMAISQILKWTHIPVVVRRDLSKAEADALRINDNATFSTEYDNTLLQDEIARLAELDPELLIESGIIDENELSKLVEDPGLAIDDGVFVDDIGSAVEGQKTENSAKEREIDGTAAPIADAFGFKRMSVEQSRTVRGFMSAIETETGKLGAEALTDWIKHSPYGVNQS